MLWVQIISRLKSSENIVAIYHALRFSINYFSIWRKYGIAFKYTKQGKQISNRPIII